MALNPTSEQVLNAIKNDSRFEVKHVTEIDIEGSNWGSFLYKGTSVYTFDFDKKGKVKNIKFYSTRKQYNNCQN